MEQTELKNQLEQVEAIIRDGLAKMAQQRDLMAERKRNGDDVGALRLGQSLLALEYGLKSSVDARARLRRELENLSHVDLRA